MKNILSAVTIFVGSFLIFGIQPMVGRTLLPVFGGTAAVWVVCLCAFQVFLLGGYWYADWLARDGRAPKIKWHLVLLVLAVAWTLAVALKRTALLGSFGDVSDGNPAFEVLVCVLALVGFPYVLLGSNSSLVQVFAGGNYRLYAVSNAGSLIGLLAYPFVFEPYVSLTDQWIGFAIGIAAYAILLFACSRLAGQGTVAVRESTSTDRVASTSSLAFLWLLLPAVSCFLLDSLTTHVTLDVMPMPLIWTASLGLFLLSYIVGFSGRAGKLIKPFAILSLVLFLALCWMKDKSFVRIGFPLALSAYGVFLFVACTFLHSWLYTLRPQAEKLTRYYLFQSIGGAVGGVIASLVFPLTADTIAEYPVSLLTVAVLAAFVLFPRTAGKCSRLAISLVLLVSLAAGGVLYFTGPNQDQRPSVYRGRGFFGTIEVLEAKSRSQNVYGRIHEFIHGSTVHGIQVLIPGKERMPTTYYTPDASGYAICGHPKYRTGEPMRVNITGLGVGVLFCYGRTNDYYRAYEISKNAMDVATNTNLFTFVSDCPAKKELVLGDARKGLEAELAAGVEPYDVIVVDAFTGDNLPYHLSTKEAFDLYFKLLKPDGILCVNISNWHLQLEPFMKKIAQVYDVPLLGLSTANEFQHLQFASKVAFFCREPDYLGPLPVGRPNVRYGHANVIDFERFKAMPYLPTDEKGSFVGLVKW